MPKILMHLASLILALPLLAQAAPETQRELFVDAFRKLEAGHRLDLEALEKELADYLLAPYLEYAYLNRNLAEAPPARVERFLSRHAELPVSALLRHRYLEHLGSIG